MDEQLTRNQRVSKSVNEFMSNAKRLAGDFGAGVNQTVPAIGNAATALGVGVNKGMEAFGTGVRQVGPAIGNAATSFGTGVSRGMEALGNGVGQVVPAVGGAAKDFGTGLKRGAESFGWRSFSTPQMSVPGASPSANATPGVVSAPPAASVPSYTGDTRVSENPSFGGGLVTQGAPRLGAEIALPEINKKEERTPAVNGNDSKLDALSSMLVEAAGKTMKSGSSLTGLSREDLLNRKYDIMAARGVTDAFQGMAPTTTVGQLGIAQMANDVARGHLGVEQDRNELAKTKVGIDISELGLKGDTMDLARAKEAREGVETTAKMDYYAGNAEESRARGRAYDAGIDKPDKIAQEEHKKWNTEYADARRELLPQLQKLSPEEQDKKLKLWNATYHKVNAPPGRKTKNADGSITTTYPAASGLPPTTTKPKEAQ